MLPLPVLNVLRLKNAHRLPHYLVAAYASTEAHTQNILVVDKTRETPTWLLRPNTRRPARRNVLGLLVPDLSTLTLHIAQDLVQVQTDFITLREWPLEDRVKSTHPSELRAVRAPWLSDVRPEQRFSA